ncbi:MAG TPA: hypothetical protein VKT78_02605 [Fimbriimonadaceae bacterium]|nr:hypothetical protein [Fimbriimonadaceae bacterium]
MKGLSIAVPSGACLIVLGALAMARPGAAQPSTVARATAGVGLTYEYRVLYFNAPILYINGNQNREAQIARYHATMSAQLEQFLNAQAGWQAQPLSPEAINGAVPVIFFRPK